MQKKALSSIDPSVAAATSVPFELSTVAAIPPWNEISGRLEQLGWSRIWWVAVGAAVEPAVCLRDAARDCNMSLARLNRTLRSTVGLTFHQLRMRIRLSLALQLLSERAVSLESAAAATGFDSVRSLEHWCRRLLGRSLGEWRGDMDGDSVSDALAQLGEAHDPGEAGVQRAAG